MGSQGVISGAIRAKTNAKAPARSRGDVKTSTRASRSSSKMASGAQLKAGRSRSSRSGNGGARPGAGRPKGITTPKRTPVELAAIEQKFVTFVRANPGLRIEEINKQTGTTTKELMLPVRRLIMAGRIKTQGELRSTRYFPAGRKL